MGAPSTPQSLGPVLPPALTPSLGLSNLCKEPVRAFASPLRFLSARP